MSRLATCERCGNEQAKVDSDTGSVSCWCDDLTDAQLERELIKLSNQGDAEYEAWRDKRWP